MQNNIRCCFHNTTTKVLYHYTTPHYNPLYTLHHTTIRNPAICRDCPSHGVPFITGYLRSSARVQRKIARARSPNQPPMWTRIERIDRIDILCSYCTVRDTYNASLLMTVVPRCSVPPQLVLSGALPRAATTYISLRG